MVNFLRPFFILLALCIGAALHGQQLREDSLQIVIKNSSDDTNKVSTINSLAKIYYKRGDYDSTLALAQRSEKLATQLHFERGLATALNIVAAYHYNKGHYPEAMKLFLRIVDLRNALGDRLGVAYCYNNIASIEFKQGNYPAALNNYFASLTIKDSILKIQPDNLRNLSGMAISYLGIGTIYYTLHNSKAAIANHEKALLLQVKIADEDGSASTHESLGLDYLDLGDEAKAFSHFNQALAIFKNLGSKIGMAAAYENLGNASQKKHDFNVALKNYFEAQRIQEEIGEVPGLIATYANVGTVYFLLKNNGKAKSYLNRATEMAHNIGSKENLKYCYAYLSSVDSALGDYLQSFQHYKLFIIYRDSLVNEENTKKNVKAQMQYEFDKTDVLHKAEQEKKDFISSEEKRKQRMVLWFVVSGLGLVVLVAVLIFRNLILSKRKNKTITEQKKTVEHQKHIVEEKQKEILDSIRYAKRIQTALLTSERYIGKHLDKRKI